MKHFRNILCVIGPEPASVPTLERAVTLAQHDRAELTVVDVIPKVGAGVRIPGFSTPAGAVQAGLAAERLQALKALTEPYQQRIRMHHAVLSGTGFLQIIRLVLKGQHDLVIKPAEAPGFLPRLFGSDDMHLLRKCPCPVWITRPSSAMACRNIVAAVDFDPDHADPVSDGLNRQILEFAAALAVADTAALHLVHAWDAPGEFMLRTWSNHPDTDIPAYVSAERDRHRRGFDRIRDQLREQIGSQLANPMAPRFHLERGSAGEVIPRLAGELAADIVVMGTVARTGVAGLFIGNTAESILEQLQCAVLAVKPPGFESPVRLDGGP